MRATTLALCVGLAVFAATPALACFPADPNRPALSPADSARARPDRQNDLWALSSSVYLGRIASTDWVSESGPAPRDMGVEVTLDSVASVKGPLPPRQTLQMIACEPQDHARASWRPDTTVIVYARRINLFEDWRRAGQWQVFAFIPMDENADPRIGPALRASAARQRPSGN